MPLVIRQCHENAKHEENGPQHGWIGTLFNFSPPFSIKKRSAIGLLVCARQERERDSEELILIVAELLVCCKSTILPFFARF